MSTVERIKSEIKRLYEADPNIHISVRMTHPKVNIERTPVKIVGIYKNIFQVEENDGDRPRRYTVQYGEVLTGQVVIEELDYVPAASILNKK